MVEGFLDTKSRVTDTDVKWPKHSEGTTKDSGVSK